MRYMSLWSQPDRHVHRRKHCNLPAERSGGADAIIRLIHERIEIQARTNRELRRVITDDHLNNIERRGKAISDRCLLCKTV